MMRRTGALLLDGDRVLLIHVARGELAGLQVWPSRLVPFAAGATARGWPDGVASLEEP